MPSSNKPWDSANFSGGCGIFPPSLAAFQYGTTSFGHEGVVSPWNQSMCTGSTCTAGEQGRFHDNLEDDNGEESNGGKDMRNMANIFNTDCVLWDIPSDDLINSTQL